VRAAHSVIILAAALLVAGCGGDGSAPGVASLTGGTATTAGASSASADPGGGAAGGGGAALDGSSGGSGGGQSGDNQATVALGGSSAELLKFAQCVRANGVPNFPDPNAQGLIQFDSSSGVNLQAPQFQAAERKCARYRRTGGPSSPAQKGQFEVKALAFSACMRAHGVSNFPDPQIETHGGAVQLRLQASAGAGLDPNSPIFQSAQKACQGDLPAKGPGLPVGANKGP